MEFSKKIVILCITIVFPSVLGLSGWVCYLAYLSIINGYTGALPYLTAIITPAWAAFTVILGCYFGKAKAENVKKIERRDV